MQMIINECPNTDCRSANIEVIRQNSSPLIGGPKSVRCMDCNLGGPLKEGEANAILAWNNLPRKNLTPLEIVCNALEKAKVPFDVTAGESGINSIILGEVDVGHVELDFNSDGEYFGIDFDYV